MKNTGTDQWCDFRRHFRTFGPLMLIDDIASRRSAAGFDAYSNRDQEALVRFADYAHSFLAQPAANLGREGNVCPFVPTALKKKAFRATATGATDIEAIETAMTEILPVFRSMPPQSPSP